MKTPKNIHVYLFAAMLLAAIHSNKATAENPFITSIYTEDPTARVWSDGRLYVYPSHDVDPPKGGDLLDRYHVYSTADMVNWRDEGEILRQSQVKWGRPEGGFMWAPDCAYKNGTYYYYFPHPSGTDWNNTWKVGVATSDKPASGFKPGDYMKGVGGFALIDPALFIDTDGQAYFYYGGGGKCKGGKLKANMTEIDGEMQDMKGLEDFHEATWVFKRNGIYYLTHADNHREGKVDANQMRYATSSGPLGPWTPRGVYLGPTGSETNHGSIVEYKGQWYAFYHNKAISGKGNLRSICVDLLNFNPDGTIQKVVQTKTGVPAVGPAPAPNPNMVKYEAENAVAGGGAAVVEDPAASGGKSVQNLHLADSTLQFNNVSGGKDGGRATIDICHACEANTKVRLTVNGVDYSFINTLSTGGRNKYTGHACFTVPLQAGATNTIRLVGGNGGVNIDYITISPF